MLEPTVFAVSYSQDHILLSVPEVRLKMGERSFKYVAPVVKSLLLEELGLREYFSLHLFESRLKVLKDDASGCTCFDGSF